MACNYFNQFPELSFSLVGYGPLENKLKQISKSNINFLGAISNKNLKEVYKQYDIFILGSTSEVWGLVVEEALNCGLPILLTNNAGIISEYSDTDMIISFNPKDLKSFDSAVKNIITPAIYNKMAEKISHLDFEKSRLTNKCIYLKSKTMKILIDNSNLVAGGGIQVATSFLNDLKEINDTNTLYHVIQSPNSAKSIDKNKFSKNFIFYDLDDETTKSKTKRIKKVKEIENKISPNTIFVTFGPSYHKSSFPKIVGFAIPYIIYSDSPFFEKISFIEKLKYKGLDILKRKMFITNSDVLIFETENARQIFCEKIKFNKPTYTVGNTLNSIFNRKEEWTEISIQKTGIDVLFLTANYAHKNIQIVPQIIDEMLKIDKDINFKFYISVTKEELNFDEKYNHYIQYLGRVEQEKIPSLYSQMDIVLMPTLLEIFSTTYLEAMHMQVPIIASDMGFARDICLDSVLFSSPLNAKDYAEKILMLSENSNLRNELITKGTENLKRFGTSMDRTQKYLEIIKEYANQR